MFYVIGLGLCDERDITVRGLEVCNTLSSFHPGTHALQAVKGCSRVYLEAYTSILMVQKEKLVSERRYNMIPTCTNECLQGSILREGADPC